MSVATELFPLIDDGIDDDAEEAFFAPGHGAGRDVAVRPRHLHAVPARTPAPTVEPRRVRSSRPGGSVSVLLAPEVERPPLRLTRRGVVVLSVFVALIGAALVAIAALSSPADGAGTRAGSPLPAASVVTVRPGDTLWTIAGRVAPGTDPRAEVDVLRELNQLDGVALEPGQQLRVH